MKRGNGKMTSQESLLHVKFKSYWYLVYTLSSGVPGVGAAVQGVQVAAEQGLTAAFATVQVFFLF